jgi:hypothetical protein
MVENPTQATFLNKAILFLTIVVTIATVCSLAITVLALPSDKIVTGIWIEIFFIITILISAYLTNRWVK